MEAKAGTENEEHRPRAELLDERKTHSPQREHMRKYSMFALEKRLISLISSLVFLVIAACAPLPGSFPDTGVGQIRESESSLADTKWKLVSFGQPGAETPVIDGSTITLEFDAVGQAGGSGGCNAYSAQFGHRLSHDRQAGFNRVAGHHQCRYRPRPCLSNTDAPP